MDGININSLPLIAGLVFLLMYIYKTIFYNKQKFLKIIPAISCLLGMILGVVIYITYPSAIPTKDIFNAILIGGISGLSSTGIHQAFKQLYRTTNNEKKVHDKTQKNK